MSHETFGEYIEELVDDVAEFVSDIVEPAHHEGAAGHPVHVWIDGTSQVTHRQSPDFASFMTWPIPQVGIGTPLLFAPRKPQRYKAKHVLTFPAAGTIWINSKSDPLSLPTPQGFTYTVAAAGNFSIPDYDAQQPLYAIASIAGVTISQFDESFAVGAGDE